jgi:16S rRNA (guanine527-N7)-methyltransferase
MDAMSQVLEVLDRSRRLGFLGPGSVRVHVEHALGFAVGVEQAPGRFLDLGSGGGIPGLVLASHWESSEAVLLDARERRCTFLMDAVHQLGLAGRVGVECTRAEDAGRRDGLRAAFDAVVARGFGRPAVTAECGAPFLGVGGTLVVSEPPPDTDAELGDGASGRGGEARWPPTEVARLGLEPGPAWTDTFRYQALRQRQLCPTRFPRRPGIPAKRPLF